MMAAILSASVPFVCVAVCVCLSAAVAALVKAAER